MLWTLCISATLGLLRVSEVASPGKNVKHAEIRTKPFSRACFQFVHDIYASVAMYVDPDR